MPEGSETIHLGVLAYRRFTDVSISCGANLFSSSDSDPTSTPTGVPTRVPTSTPTRAPTSAPTRAPTSTPTRAPTSASTRSPRSDATSSPAVITKALRSNRRAVRVDGRAGQVHHFIYTVAPDVSQIHVRLRKGLGNADLYASFDRPNVIGADEGVNDCVSRNPNNTEDCASSQLSPVGNLLYISVYGVTDFRAAKLKIITS